MRLSVQEIVNIFYRMQNNGVVIYGAGKRGQFAFDALTQEGICITEVADRKVGKKLGGYSAKPLEEICARAREEVCIVTPKEKILPEEEEKLKSAYEIVTDMSIIYWMQYFVPKDTNILDYSRCFPFNHFESPYSSDKELEVWRVQQDEKNIRGIDFNLEKQKAFFPILEKYATDFFNMQQKQQDNFRYKLENQTFNTSDAVLLHSMIREYKPNNIIEIGSGYSSCVMLDTREFWLKDNMNVTCIEPYPKRLLANIKEGDKEQICLREEFVQKVPLEVFDALEENDILFIDSSHVAKVGGDVLYEYFDILPRIKSGVIIHIHDIFYPFTYPKHWILSGRAYDEGFILRALLTDSNAYEILFFNDMMVQKCKKDYEKVEKASGGKMAMGGGSIWLRKR